MPMNYDWTEAQAHRFVDDRDRDPAGMEGWRPETPDASDR